MVAQPADSTVGKLIDAHLQVISNYLDKKESSLQKISGAVSFFTELKIGRASCRERV